PPTAARNLCTSTAPLSTRPEFSFPSRRSSDLNTGDGDVGVTSVFERLGGGRTEGHTYELHSPPYNA
ncbi:hypothetical protein PJJ27_29205, partial [Mycobacterium kansasii]